MEEESKKDLLNNTILPNNQSFDGFSNTLIDNIPGIFSIVSPDAKFLKWNKNFVTVTGYNPAETPDLTALDLFEGEDKERVAAEIVKTFAAGHSKIEAQLVSKTGHKTDFVFTANTIEYNGQTCITAIGIDVTEKNNALKQVASSNATFRGAFEHSPIGMAIVSLEGKWLQVNTHLCQLLGYTEEEMLQMGYKDIAHPNHKEENETVNSNFKQGLISTYSSERVYLKKDKSPIWVSLNLSLIKDSEGKPMHFIAQIEDITEQKEAHDKIAESDKKYRKLVQQASDAILLFDLAGRFIEVNEQACVLFGYSTDEFLQLNLTDVLEPEELALKPLQWNLLNEGKSVFNERLIVKKDGSKVDIELNSKIFTKGNVLSIVRDISEKKKTARELTGREQRYNMAIEGIDAGVWDFDSLTSNLYLSPKYLKLVERPVENRSYSLEELSGWMVPEDYKKSEEVFMDYLAGKTSRFTAEVRFIMKDGSQRWFSYSGKASYNPDGTVAHIVGSLIDIHSRKQAEAALAEREQRYDAALQGIDAGVWDFYDLENKLLLLSPRYLQLIGRTYEHRPYSLGELESWIEPLDLNKIQAAFYEHLNGKTSHYSTEARFVFPDGSHRWFAFSGKAVYDTEGNPIRAVGSIIDIHDRKLAEEKLNSSHKELSDYKIALDESSIVAITDQKGIINYVNDNFCKISKYSREELIGQDHRIVNSAYHTAYFIHELWKTIANGKIWRGDMRNKAKDGTIYWVETTIVPFLNEQGKPWQYVAIRSDITERKKFEEQQKLFVSIVNSSDDAIISKTLDGIITSWNPGAHKIFGYTAEEVIGKHITLLIPHDRYNEEAEIIGQIKEGHSVEHYETIRLKKDGTPLTISLTVSPVKNDQGIIIGASKIARDITAQKAAEEAIRASEETRRLIMDASLDAIICIDPQGKIILWTPQAEETFGWKEEEVLGKTLAETIIPPQYVNQHTAGFKQYQHTGIGTILNRLIEITALNKNGQEFPIEMSIVSIKNGSANFVCGFLRDITLRKASEQALVASEANLKTIFDTTDIAYTLIDTNFKTVSFNASAAKFASVGLNRHGQVGDYVPDYFSEDRKGFIIDALNETLAGNNINYESAYPQPDGSTNWYSVKLAPVTNANKKVLGIMLAITNITKNKIAELQREKLTAEVIQRNKDLEQFAYIVSHNLRAPVANIMGFAEELKDLTYGEEERNLFTSELASSVTKLDGVIKDLNHILQVKREVSEMKEAVTFSQMLHDIQNSIKNMIVNEQVVIQTDFSSIDQMQTTKSYLYSIFYNLLTNSIKYRRPGIAPLITITSQKVGDNVTIRFKDNGLGIDLEKKGEQVFGMYKRFHTHAAEGKGMGLYMTKTQVEAIGGKISLTSKVNEGTEFIIDLPL